jgi:hypothetical protein
MLRPAPLNEAIIDEHIPHTEPLLSEEINIPVVDAEKFSQSLSSKTVFQKVGLVAATCNFILYPALFANFMRVFWQVQAMLKSELDNDLYYRCEILPDVRTAISYDGATLRGEGAGLTTTSAAIGAAVALVAAQYQMARYCWRRHQFSQAKNLHAEVDRFIDSLELENPEQEKKVRMYLLDAPLDKLTILLSKERDKSGLDKEIVAEIQNLGTAWEKFAEDLAWFRDEVNTSYLMPVVGIATIPAFIITFIAAYQLYTESTCDTFPLIADLTDTCDVTELYKNLSLLTYFWDILSVSGLGVYCLVLLARFITAIPSLRFMREMFYKEVHVPYFQTNPDNWVYKKLTWRMASYVFVPALVSYSFVQAYQLADNYLSSMACPPMSRLLWSIYTDNHSEDINCPASEKSMAIAGFLGDFEIVKVEFMLLFLTCASYLGTGIWEKYFRRAEKDLSEQEKIVRKTHLNNAKTLLAKLDRFGSKSWDYALAACIIMGTLQFIPIKSFADGILHHDLEVFHNFNNTLISNATVWSNDTLPQMINYICPYDNLTGIIMDMSSTHFNITDIFNATARIKIIDNSTLSWQIAPACEQQEIMSVYFHNMLGTDSNCDPLLETRSIGAFIGPYWLGVSFVGGGIYILATGSQLLLWGIQSVKKRFSQQETPVEAKENIEEDDNDSYVTLRGLPERRPSYPGFFTKDRSGSVQSNPSFSQNVFLMRRQS